MSIDMLNATPRTNERREILTLQVYRLKSGMGIGLYAKSPEIEQWIRANTINPESIDSNAKSNFNISNQVGWAGHLGYKLQNKEELKALSAWGQNLTNNNISNISFLTAKGLGNGVTFEFDGMFGQSTIERFLIDVKRQVKALWTEHKKEKNCVIHSTMREVE